MLAPDAEWYAEVPGPWDCRGRRDVLSTYQRHLDKGARGEVVEVVEVGDYVVLGMQVQYPGHEPAHGGTLVYQVLTMRDANIVRMQDHPDRASALQAVPGLA